MNFDIEQLLSDLPLRKPSADLDKRIEAAFWHARWNRRLRWTSLAGVAVAAVFAGALTVNLFHNNQPATETPGSNQVSVAPVPPVIAPTNLVHYSSDVTETIPAGVYRGQDGTPIRAFRRVGVKEIWTVDPVTHQKVKTTVPQEETILVPANFD